VLDEALGLLGLGAIEVEEPGAELGQTVQCGGVERRVGTWLTPALCGDRRPMIRLMATVAKNAGVPTAERLATRLWV
jgi:hypothetical protein